MSDIDMFNFKDLSLKYEFCSDNTVKWRLDIKWATYPLIDDFTNISPILYDGTYYYHLNGLLHREDGPAIEYAGGDKFWLFNGKQHRADGPAVVLTNGNIAWCYQGKHMNCSSQEEFERLIKLKIFW